ncbi:MAG: prolipoprotein diacylglyceryl transferase [Endomicrobium sp.]|jgi:phosphatidylglycerol:prolipoprotein diacylglycerol transferase|nr:prolipoprotein diacylglyceryl transferase [Endomicrobium sp.]
MYPILLKFRNFTIYSYGFFYALALLFAVFYIINRSKKYEKEILSKNEIYSFFFYGVLFSILGARVFYVISNLRNFIRCPIDILKIWNGGLIYYGGFISVTVFIFFYTKKKKISILKFSDFVSPAAALGHAVGRIGCFFAGCCYGRQTDVPWSVVFKDKNSLAVLGIPLHPVQLYESLGNFLIFLFLHIYSKKKHKEGKILAAYFICYAFTRFIVEFFRGDHGNELHVFGLSSPQVLSVLLFIAGVFIICLKR